MANASVRHFLRDSAVIVTGLTAIPFVWGFAFDAFRAISQSVPGMFRPEVPFEERLTVGGFLAVFVFLPLAVLLYGLDGMAKGRLGARLRKLHGTDMAHRSVLYVLAMAVSLGIVQGTSLLTDEIRRPIVVERLELKGRGRSPEHEGLTCIGMRSPPTCLSIA